MIADDIHKDCQSLSQKLTSIIKYQFRGISIQNSRIPVSGETVTISNN